MAPPVSPSLRPEGRRRKPRHPHAARVDSIGVYSDVVQKPQEEEPGMQLRHRKLQSVLPNKAPALSPAPQHKPNQPITDLAPPKPTTPAKEPKPATEFKQPRAPAPARQATPKLDLKGPCANPKCGATHSPQWRTGPHSEVLCNACATFCTRHPGCMRNPATAPSSCKQQAANAAMLVRPNRLRNMAQAPLPRAEATALSGKRQRAAQAEGEEQQVDQAPTKDHAATDDGSNKRRRADAADQQEEEGSAAAEAAQDSSEATPSKRTCKPSARLLEAHRLGSQLAAGVHIPRA